MAKVLFYNTMTRKKEEFTPLGKDFVRIYDCGPTVYWYAHIGNMWRYMMSDLTRRVLEYNNYSVKQVMNLTDVGHLSSEELAADTGEDKMVMSAKKEGKTVWEVADFYAKAFFDDLKLLNIQTPNVVCKATDHVNEMVELIKKLEVLGFTYRVGNHIIFDLSKFPEYGKLSHHNLENLKSGTRLEPLPGKKNPYDFSLWIVDPEHAMHWPSPWGEGYPGWHIECSAMSMKYLGEQLDIHSGGQDNMFPHHENEIAQSEAITGKKFVQFWMYAGWMQVDDKKMSKSKGTVYRIADLVEKGYDPLAFRYLCLTAHYRTPLNFTFESLDAAQTALRKLQEFASRFPISYFGFQNKTSEKAGEYKKRFLEAVNDDIDLPKALTVVWELVKDTSMNHQEALALLADFDKVLGLRLLEKKVEEEVPAEVLALLKSREEARKSKDFKLSDKLRNKISALGFLVEDTLNGQKLTL